MKLFDENGNHIGEIFEDTKEKVETAFEWSWWWGIIFLLFIAPGWTILGVLLFLIFKIIIGIFKFVFKIVWWGIRLPFSLIFRRVFPRF